MQIVECRSYPIEKLVQGKVPIADGRSILAGVRAWHS